jgi:DnaD/phage-associated family protein
MAMGSLTLYNDRGADTTLVSNRFIDQYMKNCNDAQLKVYLYLLRMIGANLVTSISEIADQFNYTEKDIIRALKYCEKQGLVCLDYDKQENIRGIHIQDLDQIASGKAPKADAAAVTGEDPAAFAAAAVGADPAASASPAQETSAVRTPPAPDMPKGLPAKKDYSPDEIRQFKKDDDFSRILFISESYLGRPLTSSDIQTFLFIYDKLKLSVDLIDYLVEYCVEHHKTSHLYIQKVALGWAEEGITTVSQAKASSTRYRKIVYTVMKALGNFNAPTEMEASVINRWTDEYGFTSDIILKACERSVLATANNRLNYTDGILSSWNKSGVHNISDIEALDKAHTKKAITRMKSGNTPAYSNTFNQFEQRSYDYASLEKQLLGN